MRAEEIHPKKTDYFRMKYYICGLNAVPCIYIVTYKVYIEIERIEIYYEFKFRI